MLVLFKPSPQSIIKAYLASKVHKGKPVEDTESRKFYFEEFIDVDKLDYDSIYEQFKEAFGGLDFLEDEKLWEILEDEIFWASRYNSPDRLQLIFTVLSQIEKNGTRAYLSQQSPESKEMKDRVRRVTGELRRAKQFLTFAADERNKAMIGKGSLEHLIVDIVLRHYAKRFPGYSIAILDDTNAHILCNDEVLIDTRKRFPEKIGKRDSARYWMLLTDARNIEAKRDRMYYGIPLPRNYWKWVSEGVQLYGPTPKITLDSFSA